MRLGLSVFAIVRGCMHNVLVYKCTRVLANGGQEGGVVCKSGAHAARDRGLVVMELRCKIEIETEIVIVGCMQVCLCLCRGWGCVQRWRTCCQGSST